MGGFFLLDKVVKLVSGGSVINRAYSVYYFFFIYRYIARVLTKSLVVAVKAN